LKADANRRTSVILGTVWNTVLLRKSPKTRGGADNDAGKSGILVIGRNDNIITAQVRSGSFLKNR